MKVKDLIEKLTKVNQEANVVLATTNDIEWKFKIIVSEDDDEILLDSDSLEE